jgi:2-dehydro-3-deoxy-D-arabinonate dehydratase
MTREILTSLWRVSVEAEVRLAIGNSVGPEALLPPTASIARLLSGDRPFGHFRELPTEPLLAGYDVLPPIDLQEIWAAGVTFQESRYAREQESRLPDVYRDVYFAERPELFLKAPPGTAVGPGEAVGVRADSTWDVPEPELALVLDARGQLVAFTLGNDVSSRSIEGANPLYLPQAKIYDRSCAIGPCLVAVEDAPPLEAMQIEVAVHRDGTAIYADAARLSELRRSPAELGDWLFRARDFPHGALLLSGTGIVPPADFTLMPDDVVEIAVEGLGTLRNSVQRVGRRTSSEVPM